MGKREIKFSLGTADPELAGIRFKEETAKLERMWHEHLHGRKPVELSQCQLSALAGEFYREMIAKHRDNPGKPLDWEFVLKRDREKIARRFPLQRRKFHMRFTFGEEARSFLERKGYHLVGDTFDDFVEEFVFAKHLAAEQLQRNASKDWKEDPKADDFAKPEVLVSDGKVDAMEMFNRYADEAQNDEKTRRSWSTKVKSLTTFVGHNDLARLTADDVIAWKDKLLITMKKQSEKDKKAGKPDETLDPRAIKSSYHGAGDGDAIEFGWCGNDEMEPADGDGWAELRDDGSLEGEICLFNGDDIPFIARRSKPSSTAC